MAVDKVDGFHDIVPTHYRYTPPHNKHPLMSKWITVRKALAERRPAQMHEV